jgi:hypothetical protein
VPRFDTVENDNIVLDETENMQYPCNRSEGYVPDDACAGDSALGQSEGLDTELPLAATAADRRTRRRVVWALNVIVDKCKNG